MDNRLLIFFALTLLLFFTGCATFVNEANQKIKVEVFTRDKSPVKWAVCVGSNDYGEVTADRNGIIDIRRSSKDLLITCTKYGEDSGSGLLISHATGAMYGNILIGGPIGAAMDHGGGAGYAYPRWVRIILGEDLLFDLKNVSKKSNGKENVGKKSSKENKFLFDTSMSTEKSATHKNFPNN